jgi:sigma-E factor negative regulatory protein RseA
MKSEISALMDGELDDKAADAVLAQVKQEDELLANWAMFHAISEALRRSDRGDWHSPDFFPKFRERLANEPTVIAPRQFLRSRSKPVTYALSVAASLAAVALVVWVAGFGESGERALLARKDAPALVGQTGETVSEYVRDYLIAHQEFSPSTAMQGVAPYVRSVSLGQSDEANR